MAKSKIAVVVDSTAYLTEDLLKKYDIYVIPLIVAWEGESLLDNVDITPSEFYQRLTEASEMPTTSQPSVGQFKELFDKLSGEYEGIVAILISEALSGTMASAKGAKDLMDGFPIEIVNSKSTATGLGFMALEAARAAQEGKTLKEVANAARGLVEKMRVVFVVDTLEFLHRGGRIGGAKRLMGSVLAIKPLLNLVDGKIEPLDSVRTKKKAVARMLEIAKEETGEKGNVHVAVFHGLAEAEAKEIYEQLQVLLSPVEIRLAELSPVIGVHTGPGTVALSYYVE